MPSEYSLDLNNPGVEWSGTFASIVATAGADLVYEGPLDNVEITIDDGESKVFNGTLVRADSNQLTLRTADGHLHSWDTASVMRLRV